LYPGTIDRGGSGGRVHANFCRYLLRPPLALARLTESARGQVVFELPHLRAAGAPHRLLDPLELIEKLTRLIPPPRFHPLRFPGVLAPPAAWRSAVIPGRPEAEATCVQHGSSRHLGPKPLRRSRGPSREG
jgi:Putative transposase